MKFNLTRHSKVKRTLDAQLVKATTDTRLKSLARRFQLLAIFLNDMNVRSGFTPRRNFRDMDPETMFAEIRQYQTTLRNRAAR